MRDVGRTPSATRRNNSSPVNRRARRSALLTAGWLIPRLAAARVTLPSSMMASRTETRFRSSRKASSRAQRAGGSVAATLDHKSSVARRTAQGSPFNPARPRESWDPGQHAWTRRSGLRTLMFETRSRLPPFAIASRFRREVCDSGAGVDRVALLAFEVGFLQRLVQNLARPCDRDEADAG